MAGGLENFWCTQIVAGPRVYTPPPPLAQPVCVYVYPHQAEIHRVYGELMQHN